MINEHHNAYLNSVLSGNEDKILGLSDVSDIKHCFKQKQLKEINWLARWFISLADPGADLWLVLCPKRYFSQIFIRSPRSRLILSILLIEIWPKHAKMTFTSTFYYLLMILIYRPSPL